MTTERTEPCPYCVRGQIANPEVYPASSFGSNVRKSTRAVIERLEKIDDYFDESDGRPDLVVCPKCKGKCELPIAQAAHELLVLDDD